MTVDLVVMAVIGAVLVILFAALVADAWRADRRTRRADEQATLNTRSADPDDPTTGTH